MADETAQGIANFGALTDMARKTAAYNALNASYGPAVAGDPVNAFNAVKADVERQTAPTQVQQAGATLAGTQAQTGLVQSETAKNDVTTKTGQLGLDTTTAIRGLHMLKAVSNPDGSVDADSARHLLSNPVYGIDPAHIEPMVSRLSQPQQVDPKTGQVISPGGSALLDDMGQALMAGGKVTGGTQIVTAPDGTTHMILHTATGGIQDTSLGNAQTVAQQSIPIKKFNAQTGRIAATSPKGIVIDAGGNANLVGGGRVTPTTIQSIQGPAGTQAKAAGSVVGKAQGTNTANHLPENVAIARADLGQMDLQYGRTFDALSKANSLVSSFSTGVGASTIGRLPASQTKALEAQIQTAKSNIALVTANMSRQGGKSSAIPVRNMQEFKAYQDALGAIDVHAAPSVVRDQIATTQRSLQNLQSGVHTMYQAKYGDSLGVQPPASAATPGAHDPLAAAYAKYGIH